METPEGCSLVLIESPDADDLSTNPPTLTDLDPGTNREQLTPVSASPSYKPKLTIDLRHEDDRLFVNIGLTNDSQAPMMLPKTFERRFFRITLTSNLQNKEIEENCHFKACHLLMGDNITTLEPGQSLRYTNIEITRIFRIPFDQVNILTVAMQYHAIYRKEKQTFRSNECTRSIYVNKPNFESHQSHI